MKIYKYYLIIIIIFNYFFLNVLAENKYYLISIKRNPNDKEYDKAGQKVQDAIDELVNDRMNDVYDIIEENKETFKTKNGKYDEKLEELTIYSKLRKRDEEESDGKRNFKFSFINTNRLKKNNKNNKINNNNNNNNSNNNNKIKTNNKKNNKNNNKYNKNNNKYNKNNNNASINSINEHDIEYIPIKSELVKHICPVLNYYVIMAYLSESIVSKIKALPNVIDCSEPGETKNDYIINPNLNDTNSDKIYSTEEILNETQWKNLTVQEYKPDLELRNSHLSM
eukprot:jgi/Orpsp1_1/1175212/evm.model.c7180000053020.1